jgi:hypothetical protein
LGTSGLRWLQFYAFEEGSFGGICIFLFLLSTSPRASANLSLKAKSFAVCLRRVFGCREASGQNLNRKHHLLQRQVFNGCEDADFFVSLVFEGTLDAFLFFVSFQSFRGAA